MPEPIKISYSKFWEFKFCPRRYELHHELGLVPKIRDLKLEEGRIVHRALEYYYKNQKEMIKPYVKSEMQAHTERVLDAIKKGYATGDDFKKAQARFQVLWHVLETYFKYAPELDKNLEINPEDVEKEWEIPVEGGYVLNGVIDGLAVDKRHRTLYILEHKYTTLFSEDKMELDQQIIFYTLAVFLKTGRIPVVLYNVIIKPQYRLGKNETIEEFSERVKKELDSKGPDGLIVRREYTRTSRHLKLLAEELDGTVPQMVQKNYRYRNIGQHCTTFCPYTKICLFEDENIVREFFDKRDAASDSGGVYDEGGMIEV